MNRQILHGDVLEKFKEIPDGSIDCIITSPPYFGLRNYGVDGQIGLEPDFKNFLKTMKKVMDECKRVLRPTGTCWINLGDTYSSSEKNQIQVKSCIGIPERFYTQCIDDGWIARNNIPWIKGNPMPSSVKDKFTNKYEPVFFFVKNNKPIFYYNEKTFQAITTPPQSKVGGQDWEYKTCSVCGGVGTVKGEKHKRCNGNGIYRYSFWHSRDYYFNLDAVRVKPITESKPLSKKTNGEDTEHEQSTLTGDMIDISENKIKEKYVDSPQSNVARLHKNKEGNPNKQDNVVGADGKVKTNYKGFNERWRKNNRKWENINGQATQSIAKNHNGIYDKDGNCLNHPSGKNPGDVMTLDYSDEELLEWIKICRENNKAFEIAPPDLFYINPKPFPEAHFATFPVKLPLTILKCSCPTQVCTKCGIPRIPINNKIDEEIMQWGARKSFANYPKEKREKPQEIMTHGVYERIGYSKCDCNEPFKPGVVLDPFCGAGTTGVAAEKLGLQWMGIELNQEYIDIARKRLEPFLHEKLESIVE